VLPQSGIRVIPYELIGSWTIYLLVIISFERKVDKLPPFLSQDVFLPI
jgi:hypothetical protein